MMFALRMFLIVVGALFIWEAVPSTRWTWDISPNIQTGLWKTCSCNKVDREDCRTDYSELQKSYFRTKYNCTEDPDGCRGGSPYAQERSNNHQFQFVFKKLRGGVNLTNITVPDRNANQGMPQFTPEQWNDVWSQEGIYEKDEDECRQYLGTGAIALITYIFAFLGFILSCFSLAAGKNTLITFPVVVCVVMTGIWGLIASVMFSDLLGKDQDRFPLGHQFSVFTVSWIVFFCVGISGAVDMRNPNASSTIAAVRSAAFATALVGFAYSFGNDWFVQDQQALIAPMGGFQWTIKAGTFFIAPASHAPYINEDSLLEYSLAGRNFDGDREKARYCDYTSTDADLRLRNNQSDLSHLVGNRNPYAGEATTVTRRERNYPRVTGESRNAETTRNHYPNQCLLSPRPTYVRGEHVIGLFNECQCKETTSLTCTLFGSYWPMFNGRTQNCNTFQVARAMVLIAALLAWLAIVASSIMVGEFRSVEIFQLSNNLCFIVALLGFIASILYGGVIYPVGSLSSDFALFLAGWWLILFGGIIGLTLTSQIRDVDGSAKVVPMVSIEPQPDRKSVV